MMDKQKALHILGLKRPVSLEQAKRAYRDLAKRYHPDMAGNQKVGTVLFETKMKEINLAFRFIVPFLKPEPEKIFSSKASRRKRKGEWQSLYRRSKQLSDFLNKVVRRIFPPLAEKPQPGPSRSNESRASRAASDPLSFDEVLNSFSTNNGEKKKNNLKTRQQAVRRNRTIYKRYQDYIRLRKRLRSAPRAQSKSSRIEPVSKIDPVTPVNRVTRR